MASAFKTFTTSSSANNNSDCGLELAVRRRRTKSLQGENQLRQKLVASLYVDRRSATKTISTLHGEEGSSEDIEIGLDILPPLPIASNGTMADLSAEDWFGNEVNLPRDADRIMEQFVIMLLRVASYLKKDLIKQNTILNTTSLIVLPPVDDTQCTDIPNEDLETLDQVGNSKEKLVTYVQEYPKIFMKKQSETLNVINLSEGDDTNLNNLAISLLNNPSPSQNVEKNYKSSSINLHCVSKDTSKSNSDKQSDEKLALHQVTPTKSLDTKESSSDDSIGKIIDKLNMRAALFDIKKDVDATDKNSKQKSKSSNEQRKQNNNQTIGSKQKISRYNKRKKKGDDSQNG